MLRLMGASIAKKRSARCDNVRTVAPTPTDRPTRKDAVRNRSRLIDAATGAFREDGLAVSVNAIARAAGVNVATLYRHFPTKDHLVAAVLEALLEPLSGARDRALATEGTGDALATFVRDAVRIQIEHGGVFDALAGQPVGSTIREHLRAIAIGIAQPIVERAHRDRALREDFDAIDLLIALRMLGAATGAQEADRDIDRYVDVVLQGLRPS
jgi:AcrR family transcriptional regulator